MIVSCRLLDRAEQGPAQQAERDAVALCAPKEVSEYCVSIGCGVEYRPPVHKLDRSQR